MITTGTKTNRSGNLSNYPSGTAAAVVEVALKEVGTIEEGDNLTKYGKFTKADGLPWCGRIPAPAKSRRSGLL